LIFSYDLVPKAGRKTMAQLTVNDTPGKRVAERVD
jgi:hypothetical protein